MAVHFSDARRPDVRKTGVSGGSFSENDDRRVEIALLCVQFVADKPEFVTSEVAAVALGTLWTEAADRCGIPPVSVHWQDRDGEDVFDPDVLRALERRDLPALLREAHELGSAGEWRHLWTVLRDAFGIHGSGR